MIRHLKASRDITYFFRHEFWRMLNSFENILHQVSRGLKGHSISERLPFLVECFLNCMKEAKKTSVTPSFRVFFPVQFYLWWLWCKEKVENVAVKQQCNVLNWVWYNLSFLSIVSKALLTMIDIQYIQALFSTNPNPVNLAQSLDPKNG